MIALTKRRRSGTRPRARRDAGTAGEVSDSKFTRSGNTNVYPIAIPGMVAPADGSSGEAIL